MIKYL
jgi:hypothetical protein